MNLRTRLNDDFDVVLIIGKWYQVKDTKIPISNNLMRP